MSLSLEKFQYGIEHEFPLLKAGEFVDFSNTTFQDIERITDQLPIYESDYPGLRRGKLGIRVKRWYIEGFERFDESGSYLRRDIKGFEIRTPICNSINQAVSTLNEDFIKWRSVASQFGYMPSFISFNPFQTEFIPKPPLNQWEIDYLKSYGEQSVYKHMLTYGPDVSISHPDVGREWLIDAGRKLTYYSPFIIPWSFSSPFYAGALWDGLSCRTDYRIAFRPVVKVFLKPDDGPLAGDPLFMSAARIPAEACRIEFKAFDTLRDVSLYGSFLALIKGILMDTSLSGRLESPDIDLHRLSAHFGFHNDSIAQQAQIVLEAARRALPHDERSLLDRLEQMLNDRRSLSDDIIDRYLKTKDIIKSIEWKESYE